MNAFDSLTGLCRPEIFRITAHRGASFDHPENTLSAMRQAVAAGADMIEFDLRATKDGVPVVLHDTTIDRTSDGQGAPETMTLAELKQYDFGWFCHGKRQERSASPGERIPSFEEILAAFRGKAGMNIQIYLPEELLPEVCRLYKKYGMYDQGYFTIAGMDTAEKVRSIDRNIEICLTPGWHERAKPENLKLCRDYGCRFVQPTAESYTEETTELCRQYGLHPNIFFADAPEDVKRLKALGATGIMTNRAPDLCALRRGL